MTGSSAEIGETSVELTVNGLRRAIEVVPTTPLLNVLRNDLGLLGAKRGCAKEQCYACSVLIDGRTQPSCVLPVGHVGDAAVTTVESEELDPLREFFVVEQVGQCAFCVSGMIVAAQGLLNQVRRPNDRQIREALDTNICRCGIYDRVRRAIRFRIGEPEDPIWEVRRQAPLPGTKAVDREPSRSLAKNPGLDSWLAINRDETVTVFTGKAELGQGISTALAGIAADELSVDVGRVRMVGPDTACSPDEGVTSGSMSVETSGAAIRAAARTARTLLLQAAAAELGAPLSRLTVHDGTVTADGSNGQSSYWTLQGGQPFQIEVDPDLEGEIEGQVDVEREVDVGREVDVESDSPTDASLPAAAGARHRIDLPAKLSGLPSYVHDLRLPGTLHGRVVRPPNYRARLQSVDRSAAAAVPGVVEVVSDGSFLGVVAEREEQADTAADALAAAVVWSTAAVPLPDPREQLLSGETADYFVVDGVPVEEEIEPPITHATINDLPHGVQHRATYSKPFTLHGSLGPSAAVARFDDQELTVWSHTQGVFPLRGALAQVLDMSPQQVRVIHKDGPGCYGHNGADDVALDAALLARAVPGRPVLVSWSRADEHRWEPWGPAMMMELHAVVEDGRIDAFDSRNWSYSHTTRPGARDDGATTLLAGWHIEAALPRPTPTPIRARHIGTHRNSDPLYNIARRRLQSHVSTTTDYRTSALRALGSFGNTFAIESFVDELAVLAGVDAVEFRTANLADERAVAVIQAAAEAGRLADPAPDGHGRGLAFGRYKNSQTYLAAVVEVAVDRTSGAIDVIGATIAADAGRIVNPDGLSNQLEGGCVQAASWTLTEEVRLGDDRVISDDWESYPVLRFSQSFPVATILLDRPDQPSLGCGEAAQGPSAAAITNAVFAAVGVRFRDLPLTADKVMAAITAAPQSVPDLDQP